ncbi:MAG: DMT family transporter [Porticoccaceae bacterium]|nr:DMT family transporter [Porticoccaceae bacterium]MDG1475264.1 DMT family transporter [Porticoccaceae bacterium]
MSSKTLDNLTGRWKFGLFLAASTALMWGVLPLALKGIMVTLDPMTTTFFRFFLAAALITPYLIINKKLINRHKFRSFKLNLQFLAAGGLLIVNYALYIFGLERTTAEAAQVMMQLAPITLLLAGVVVFKERFSVLQWCGFGIFVSGLLLFFSPRFASIFVALDDYGLGLLMLMTAACTWVGYAIIQKFLLRNFNAEETMLVFYWMGALAFLPFSRFDLLSELTEMQWGLLIFCGLNTLIAYGCFSEAMAHIEASRVSAVIASTPIITLSLVQLMPNLGIQAEILLPVTLLGAACVVIGSIITATMKS